MGVKMKKRKGLIISLAIILLIIIWAAFRITAKYSIEKDVTTSTMITVHSEKVKIENIEGKISYTGTVEGINEATVISQTAGTIQKVYAEVGKKCSAGNVLVVIQNEQQQAGVEQAKAQVLLAETNYEKATKDLERTEKLFNEKVATKDNLELAQLNVKSAQAQLKGAQASLKVSEKQLSDTYIKATISGRIASKEVNLGGTVTPGTKIATLVDNSKVKVKLMVSETDVIKLKQNQEALVKVDAIPGKEFKGKISTIGLVTEQSGRSYTVEVIVDNKGDGEIKSGMFARCEIVIEQKNEVITAPEKAVIINNDGSASVFVIETGKAFEKKVKLGIKGAGKYEILDGLKPDSKIVIEGSERLKDGIEVKEK
jgi:RND family efflux transporter MFP subunit